MLKLRFAQHNDIELLYNWRNDPVVRKNSFNSDYINYFDHLNWFANKIKSGRTFIYIFEVNGVPAGQIRVEKQAEKDGYISFSIAREFRGNGYGQEILKLIVDKIQADCHEIKRLIGKVKKNNISSIKSFKRAGYKKKKNSETYTEFYIVF